MENRTNGKGWKEQWKSNALKCGHINEVVI